MKITSITLGLLLGLNGLILAQSNPVPHLIANSNINFTGISDPSTSEYPSFMRGWAGAIARITPEAAAPTDIQATGKADMAANGSDMLLVNIINEGDKGISIRGNATEETPIAIALAINTTNASGLSIGWTGKILHNFANTTGSLHLQYRIGETGDWTNLSGHVYTSKPYGSENLDPEVFGPTELPAELDNQPVVQFRWMMVTHNIDANLSSTTPRIAVQTIDITTTAAEALPPIADFSVNKTNPGVEEPVSFKDNSSGEPTSFFWDFGDGTTSEEKKPVKVYENDGFYSVTFICTNSVGSDTVYREKLMAVGDTSQFTSVNTKGISQTLSVYPNPTQDFVNFETNAEETTYVIFNSKGEAVERNLTTSGKRTIDVSNLKPGLYFLTTGNNESKRLARFIKN